MFFIFKSALLSNKFFNKLATFLKIIRLRNNIEFQISRGDQQTLQFNYEKAILYYSKAIEINPHNSVSFYKRGEAYLLQKSYKKAILDFAKRHFS